MMPSPTPQQPVGRKVRTMLEIQLRSRLWLDSPALSIAEKRRIIELVRKGIHSAEPDEVNHILDKLKGHVGLRVENQRPQYATRLHGAGHVSWDHFHFWEVMKDIDVWERANPLPPDPKPKLSVVEQVVSQHDTVVKQMPMIPEAANIFAVLRDYGAPMKSAEIAELLETTQTIVSNNLCALKIVQMVEQVPHSRLWRVTELSHGYTVVIAG